MEGEKSLSGFAQPKRKFSVAWFAVAVGVTLLAFTLFRDPEMATRKRIHREFPIGMPLADAVKTLRRQRAAFEVNTNAGYWDQSGTAGREVAKMSIKIEAGDYRAFPIGTTSITVFLGFDSNGKLIDSWVWKTTDSL
jgi:hypothetical protein